MDAVARERSIDKSIVIDAMADAIQKARQLRPGNQHPRRHQPQHARLQRLLVVENVEEYARQISLADAARLRT